MQADVHRAAPETVQADVHRAAPETVHVVDLKVEALLPSSLAAEPTSASSMLSPSEELDLIAEGDNFIRQQQMPALPAPQLLPSPSAPQLLENAPELLEDQPEPVSKSEHEMNTETATESSNDRSGFDTLYARHRCCLCSQQTGIVVRCAALLCTVRAHPTCVSVMGDANGWSLLKVSTVRECEDQTQEVLALLCCEHSNNALCLH